MLYKITKLCEFCEKPFETYIKNNHRFCSQKCAQLKRKQSKMVTCEYCGAIFECQSGLDRKFCTQYCAREARKEAHWKTFVCQYCGNTFKRRPAPSSKNKYLFCSPTCRNKARAWNGPPRRHSKKWKTCPICGNQNWREGDYCLLHRPKGNDRNPVHNPIVWNDERIAFLKQNYSSMGGKEVGRILKLNPKQVINKANSIGLKLDKDASHRIIHSQARKYMINNNPMKKESVKKKVLQYWIDHPEENQVKQEKLALGKQRIQRDKPTRLELRLFGYLSELDISFEPFFLIKPRFIVDARIGNLIIQADGDYWHGHPRFNNLTERQLKQQARDKAQDKYLTTCGYTVVRIWESDMSKELIKSILKAHNII